MCSSTVIHSPHQSSNHLSVEAIDIEASLFEDFDANVSVDDSPVRLNLQRLVGSAPQRLDDILGRLPSPIL